MSDENDARAAVAMGQKWLREVRLTFKPPAAALAVAELLAGFAYEAGKDTDAIDAIADVAKKRLKAVG